MGRYNTLVISDLDIARVAKLADARDLKSRVPNGTCGFDSRPGHHYISTGLRPSMIEDSR